MVISFGFREILRNIFFYWTPQVAPSEHGSISNNVKVLKIFETIYSGVKNWKLTSKFPNRKTFWDLKGMSIPS